MIFLHSNILKIFQNRQVCGECLDIAKNININCGFMEYADGQEIYFTHNLDKNINGISDIILDLHNIKQLDSLLGDSIQENITSSDDKEYSEQDIENIKQEIYQELREVYDKYGYFRYLISNLYEAQFEQDGDKVNYIWGNNKYWDSEFDKLYGADLENITTYYKDIYNKDTDIDKLNELEYKLDKLKEDVAKIEKAIQLDDKDETYNNILSLDLIQIAPSYIPSLASRIVNNRYFKQGDKEELLKQFIGELSENICFDIKDYILYNNSIYDYYDMPLMTLDNYKEQISELKDILEIQSKKNLR